MKDVNIMLCNRRGLVSGFSEMEWVDVITISLLPILLVKREKRNSLIIPLKSPEQNKIKRDVVKKLFFSLFGYLKADM